SAADALFIVDLRFAPRSHGNSSYFARFLARSLEIVDSAVRAGLGASAALHALVLIYTGMVLIVNVDRLELTGIHARVIETAAAQVGYHVTGFRTLVTGDIDDLNHVGIL